MKTGRSRNRRRGSNPFSSANYCLFDIAGWSNLVARWAHNPEVVGSNPAPATIWFVGVVVITLACHARDHGFKSRTNRQYGFIAQLAENKTENLGVVGSIPTEATIFISELNDLKRYRRS